MATDSRPSILATARLPGAAMSMLADIADLDIVSAADANEFRAAAAGRSALLTLVTDRVDAALLDAAGPSLKIVANVAVGYDNIDLAAARARGIVTTHTPGVLTNAVAEFTWALILGITRRLGEGERQVRAGRWKGWAIDGFLGMELSGKQLGIIGAGRIGRAVAEKAHAFGMRTVFAEVGATGTIDEHPVVTIDELFRTSDVVSLHTPLTPGTRHLINATSLATMKRTAYLINTARGPVIDEAALVDALRSSVIAGAALDVFEREPVVHPGLFELENVMLIPHAGSATFETRGAMAELAARNVIAVLSGQVPITAIPV